MLATKKGDQVNTHKLILRGKKRAMRRKRHTQRKLITDILKDIRKDFKGCNFKKREQARIKKNIGKVKYECVS